MRASSPPRTVAALVLSGLLRPEVTVWTLRDGHNVLGIIALKALPDGTGEVSMCTHPDHLRKGVARALLERVIAQAKARDMTRLSLETGTGPAFKAALRLYQERRFIEGDVFGDYVGGSGFNRFFHLELSL